MPRRRRPETREIIADPVYNSTLAEKFVNSMMWDGKKAVSQRIFYDAMNKIKERTQDDPLKLFKKAVENRRTSLAIRWILQNARTRPEKSMPEKLANELNDAANSRGGAIKKKDDVHRMAEANKAFAHYRW